MNDARPCTCHPDDKPPVPCERQYALTDCRTALRARIAGLREAAEMLSKRAAQKRQQADHAFEADDDADQHGYSHAAFCLQQEADAILARIAELEKQI